MRLVLASASPRRADLLRAAGYEFIVRPTGVDESILPGETAYAHVCRLADAKAAAAAASTDSDVVLGADTVVVVDGHVLGKPADDAAAAAMLRRISGR